MKNKKFIISFVLIIALNLIAVLGCLYLYSGIRTQREAMRQDMKNLALLEKKAQNIQLLESQSEKLKTDAQKIEPVFLKEENIVGFIENLENLGKDAGVSVELSAVRMDEKNSKAPHFDLILKGSFNALFHYIVLLENLPYQIIFEKLNMSSGDKTWEARTGIILSSFISSKND